MPKLTFSLRAFVLFLMGHLSAFPLAAQSPTSGKIKIAFLNAATHAENEESVDLISGNEGSRGLEVFLKKYPQADKQFEILRLDNQGDLATTLKVLEAAKAKGVSILVGLARTEEALMVARFAEENGMLYFSPLATDPRISAHRRNTFQICFTDTIEGAALARFAQKDLHRKRIFILKNTRSLYSQALSESFLKTIKQEKGMKVQTHIYSGNEFNLESLKLKLKHFNPDMVFVADEVGNAAVPIKFVYEMDPKLPFLAGNSFGNKDRVKKLLHGLNKLRIFYSTQWQPSLADRAGKKLSRKELSTISSEFQNQYTNLYDGKPATASAALNFDAFSIFYQAMSLLDFKYKLERVRTLLEKQSFEATTGQLSYRGLPQHAPIKDVYVMVTNTEEHKLFRGMRTVWNQKP